MQSNVFHSHKINIIMPPKLNFDDFSTPKITFLDNILVHVHHNHHSSLRY